MSGPWPLLQSLKSLGPLRWPPSGQGRNWRKGLALVLLAGIVIQFGHVLWVWIKAAPQGANPTVAVAVDMATLNRADPFFAKGQAAVEASGDKGGLGLFGVSADGSGGGSAIIGLPDGTQVAVATGEEITSGAILKTVSADHVIVEMNGRFLRLGFPEVAVQQTQGLPDDVAVVANEATPSEAGIVDPVKLVAEAGLRPKMDGLSVKGLQVTAREDSAQLAAAGLQDGDIILSVNGTALTSPQALNTLRQRLSGAATAEISYERGGQRRMTSIRTR